VLPSLLLEIHIEEYLDPTGNSPFGRWFAALPAPAAARVTIALTRLAQGNFSNVEPVGAGVSELKVHFGPGYRVYFGQDGPTLVILLGGSSKARQSHAIRVAQQTWTCYKLQRAKEN
jgi:putative addiction module killer protein